ncbi:MAG: hypothetical protein C4548_05780 [Desulfobacteraceae bacterium]|jgi:hypothetical protein|nr:MAG: hypothetical protein C4548_05780 [Desulfobacteraceae bacterium]
MKNMTKLLTITLILILCGTFHVQAGEVAGLNEFRSGEPAMASEVNANFEAVKTAVDDNNAAITANSNAIVTNAANIKANTENLTRRTGSQRTSWPSPDLPVTSTTAAELTSIKVNDSGTFNVSLSAHLVIEITGTGSGRYEFTIKKGSTTGTTVGTGWWRPGSQTGIQAVTISFNGYDASAKGPETYYLCARKFDSNAPDGLIGPHGLNAEWSKASLTPIIRP